MSILTTPLPDCVIYNGRAYRLNTDFRTWLEFERIMSDNSLSAAVKTGMIYDLCFKEPPPDGAAIKAIWEFYMGSDTKKSGGKSRPVLSFEQDADYIYAAFYSQYGIDLTEQKMHWYKFRALFGGLGEDNLIVKIMHFRSVDISKIKDKNQKAFYRRMKRIYRLKDEKTDIGESLEGLFKEGSK